MESKLIKTIFLASVVWLAAAVLTQDAFAADTVIYAVRAGGAVGTLDLNTGVFSQVTSTPVPFNGLGEYAGVIYGANGGCDCLFQFDPATAATTIAPQTFNQVDNGVPNGFGAIDGLGSTTAGLFVIGAGAGSSDILYAVDPATGHPSMIGATGVIAGGGTGTLSASVDSSQLYWEVQINCTDTLYSLNTSTGAATTIGSVTVCFPSPTGNPTALVLTGGTLWANFYTYGFGTISTTSGAQHLVSTNTQPIFVGFAPFPLLPPTPVLVGSMGHLAAEENWTSTFTLVNKGVAPSQATLSFFGDASDPTGDGPLTLPLIFPQESTTATPAASIARSLAANASLIVQTAGPQTSPVLVGSAQLAAAGLVDGFAIFHQIPTAQEAVVPMETRNAASYLMAFDNTNGIALGVAVDNVSASAGNVGVIIRDDTGAQLTTDSLAVSASGHSSFVLSTQYSVTRGKRGTVEFDTPPGGQISVLGIRFTPPNNALTTIPALANVGSGGSIAHIATGNGWQTTFVLINTGTTLAPVTLKFFADLTGGPLTIPVSFPQIPGGTVSLVSSVSQPLNPGATLVIQSAAPLTDPNPTVGSAQVTTTGNVGGFVIFRYNPNGQEAVVPLESRVANSFVVAFDNTAGTATGIAVNSVSLQTTVVPVVVRDDTGAQIATDTITLPPNAHVAFTLVTDKYPQTANIRGTVEFGTPVGGQIGALGIRIPLAHTFTTLPALAKQ